MNADDLSKEQLMAVCTIYMDRCAEIRDLLTAQLDAMPDLNACTSVEDLAKTTHEAYGNAVEAMIKALGHIDDAAAEMMATLGAVAPPEGGASDQH